MSDEIGIRWSNEVLNDSDYRRRISRLDTQSFDPLPLSVHAGDTEGAHPDSCWCSVCAERERRREIIEGTFEPHLHEALNLLEQVWKVITDGGAEGMPGKLTWAIGDLLHDTRGLGGDWQDGRHE